MTTFTPMDTASKLSPKPEASSKWKILKEDTSDQSDAHLDDMATKGVSFHEGTWVDTGDFFQGTMDEVTAFMATLDGCYSAVNVDKK